MWSDHLPINTTKSYSLNWQVSLYFNLHNSNIEYIKDILGGITFYFLNKRRKKEESDFLTIFTDDFIVVRPSGGAQGLSVPVFIRQSAFSIGSVLERSAREPCGRFTQIPACFKTFSFDISVVVACDGHFRDWSIPGTTIIKTPCTTWNHTIKPI